LEYNEYKIKLTLKIGDLIMADYPHQTQSPFFKTFTPRMGNVGRIWLNTQNQQREQQARQARQAQQTVPWFGAGNTKPTRGMLGQPLTPQPWQPEPWHPEPMQNEAKQEDLPDLSSPEAAAGHIQQVNQGLPDGVRYEAIDDETQAALQKIQGMQTVAEPPLQSLTPPPHVQASPPQTAANQIQQANRGLPDGVRYEPIDDETQAALQRIQGMQTVAEPPLQSLTPPPQIQARTPQTDASQIQQANRGLPDGVRYEPIDEETKAALQKIQAMQNQSNGEPSPKQEEITHQQQAEAAPLPLPSQNTDLLKRLIQDEQNAFQYYQYLSEIAPNEDMQKKLQEISQSCNSRHNIYMQMHQDDFSAKEIKINDSIQFAQGMAIALREETKILDNMAKLIEQSESNPNLQNMLNKRLIQQTWLQWALLQTK